jgi:hypothetical protein
VIAIAIVRVSEGEYGMAVGWWWSLANIVFHVVIGGCMRLTFKPRLS